MPRTARNEDSVQVSLVELRQLEDERERERERAADAERRAAEDARRAEQLRRAQEDAARADAEAARAAELARRDAELASAQRIAAIEADARIEIERLAAERARHEAERSRLEAAAPAPSRSGWLVAGLLVLAIAQVAAFATRGGHRDADARAGLSAAEDRAARLQVAVDELRDQVRAAATATPAEPAAPPAPPPRTHTPSRPPAKPATPRPTARPAGDGRIQLDCDPALPLCTSSGR